MKNICIVVLAFLLVSCGQGGVNEKLIIDENSIVIDVRTDQEYKAGHLKKSINIPYDQIKDKIKEHVKGKEEKIILYCRSGRRSGIAQNVLKKMGYKNVVNAGAYKKLKKNEMKKE